MSDLDVLASVARNMTGTTICPLSDAAAMPLESFLGKFRGEFEEHVRRGGCPLGGRSFLEAVRA